MKAGAIEILGEFQRMTGSEQIGALECRRVGGQIIERAQVDEMFDGTPQFCAALRGQAEVLGGEVALDGPDLRGALAIIVD